MRWLSVLWFEWAVRVDDCSAGERFGVEEFESACACGPEQGFAGSFDDGRGAGPVLVEQTRGSECIGELTGSPNENVIAVGLFQLGDVVNQGGSRNDDGWVPQGRVDGLGGDDVFGDRVDVVTERVAAVVRPGLCHAFVGDSAEEECVGNEAQTL
jgi:hypothetical protein